LQHCSLARDLFGCKRVPLEEEGWPTSVWQNPVRHRGQASTLVGVRNAPPGLVGVVKAENIVGDDKGC